MRRVMARWRFGARAWVGVVLAQAVLGCGGGSVTGTPDAATVDGPVSGAGGHGGAAGTAGTGGTAGAGGTAGGGGTAAGGTAGGGLGGSSAADGGVDVAPDAAIDSRVDVATDVPVGPTACHVGEPAPCRCADGVYSVQECLSNGTMSACVCNHVPFPDARVGDAIGMVDPGTQVLHLPTYGLAADPVRNVVYVSATAISPVNPSAVVALAADTGAVLWATPVTPEPGALAISDDGSKLYVASVTGSIVRRVNIASRAVDLTFDVGTGSPVFDMAVMPGSPRTVALSLSTHAAALYDDAVLRPNMLADFLSVNTVAFAGAGLLLGFNTHTTSPYFRTATVDATGLTLADSIPDVFTDFMGDFVHDRGLAFGWDGNVFDVNAKRVLGRFDLAGKVAVDPTGTSVFVTTFLNSTQYSLVFGEFDRNTRARKRTLTLSLEGIPDVIVRATDGTLAVSVLMEPPGRSVERVVLLVHPAAW
jgi:hypothetical protein